MPGKMVVISGASHLLWMVFAACKFCSRPHADARVRLQRDWLQSVTVVVKGGFLHSEGASFDLTFDVLLSLAICHYIVIVGAANCFLGILFSLLSTEYLDSVSSKVYLFCFLGLIMRPNLANNETGLINGLQGRRRVAEWRSFQHLPWQGLPCFLAASQVVGDSSGKRSARSCCGHGTGTEKRRMLNEPCKFAFLFLPSQLKLLKLRSCPNPRLWPRSGPRFH